MTIGIMNIGIMAYSVDLWRAIDFVEHNLLCFYCETLVLPNQMSNVRWVTATDRVYEWSNTVTMPWNRTIPSLKNEGNLI